MGTIGHHTLLYDLKNWQIRAAIRGYYRSQRPIYEASRMQSLWYVSCHQDEKSPPLSLTDLVRFPWDAIEKQPSSVATEEDIDHLHRLIQEAREYNASVDKAKEQP